MLLFEVQCRPRPPLLFSSSKFLLLALYCVMKVTSPPILALEELIGSVEWVSRVFSQVRSRSIWYVACILGLEVLIFGPHLSVLGFCSSKQPPPPRTRSHLSNCPHVHPPPTRFDTPLLLRRPSPVPPGLSWFLLLRLLAVQVPKSPTAAAVLPLTTAVVSYSVPFPPH